MVRMRSPSPNMSPPELKGFARRNRFALTALVLAPIAIALCIAATVIGYREQDGMFGIGRNTDHNRIGLALRVMGGVLGFGGLILAVVGWIRHEYQRLWLAAFGLAVTALAWEFMIIALVAAFFVLLVVSFASSS